MYRPGPILQVILMAFAADVGHGEVPFLALGGAAQRHVEGMHVVAIAADGVLLGRSSLLSGHGRNFVGRDILGDDAQTGLLAALFSFFVASHRSRWHWAHSAFFTPAGFWCGVTLSMISLWQATHSILACTLVAYLSGLTSCSARFLPSAAGTSSLPFLPSWQVWHVALSSFCAAGAASVLLAAATDPMLALPARMTAAAATQAANLLVPMIFISDGL